MRIQMKIFKRYSKKLRWVAAFDPFQNVTFFLHGIGRFGEDPKSNQILLSLAFEIEIKSNYGFRGITFVTSPTSISFQRHLLETNELSSKSIKAWK